jgi:hypothetical protein
MQLEMIGWLICPNAFPGISNDLTEFDGSYMMPYLEDVQERRPQDTRQRQRTSYKNQHKNVKEARVIIPYTAPKDMGVDYRFWNEFHSDFYLSVLYNAKNSKILKMKYVD